MVQWMFLFKHLHQLAEPIFTGDPIFQRLFQVTEFHKQKLEAQMIFIDRERDMRNIKKRWQREAREEGLKEGRKEGRKEAEREKDHSLVRTLISDPDLIEQKTAVLPGMAAEVVKNIRH